MKHVSLGKPARVYIGQPVGCGRNSGLFGSYGKKIKPQAFGVESAKQFLIFAGALGTAYAALA